MAELDICLIGKVFKFTMPNRKENNNFVKILKDEEKFKERVFREIKGINSISELDVTGAYIIEVYERNDITDEQIINKISEIANEIGFE